MAQKPFEIKYYLVFQRKFLIQNIVSNVYTERNLFMYIAVIIRKRQIVSNLDVNKVRGISHWH